MTMLPKADGTSLIEVLLAIAIFTMVTTALYSLILLALHLVRDDQARLDALAIAQTRIEELRNVPYENVGTVGGIPEGDFLASETSVRNGVTFTTLTDIRYVDDLFDDVAPTDTVNTDYKQIDVTITWVGQYVDEPVLLSTIIAPEGIETNAGGGTLWLEVDDADGDPVTGATVRITNSSSSPTVDITSTTDADGRYVLPGAPAATQSYHIEVSKAGYSSSQTYPEDLVSNPNPDPQDLSVLESDITTQIMLIDLLSQLDIHLQRRDDSTPVASTDLTITGENRVGTDLSGADIPKYSATHTTDASGNISIPALEYDVYNITIDEAATGYDIAGFSSPIPTPLPPDTTSALTVKLADAAPYTALITITDTTGAPITSATVRLTNPGLTVDVTEATDSYGQTFFTPLTAESYTALVTADGYEDYTTTIEISGDQRLTLPLTSTP